MQSKQSTSQLTPARAAENVRKLIDQSQNILVLCSRPSDIDSYGTGAALGWYLEQLGKTPTVATRFKIEGSLKNSTATKNIQQWDNLSTENFANKVLDYDLVIGLDSSSWKNILGENFEELLEKLTARRMIAHIDHHTPGDIIETIPQTCLFEPVSCTAELLYKYFLKPADMIPPQRFVQWMYEALLYDTNRFRNNNTDVRTFEFATELLRLGADHLTAIDSHIPWEEMLFASWAIAHTERDLDLRATFLVIDAQGDKELNELIGTDWEEYQAFYKDCVLRQIEGIDYGILINFRKDGTYKVGWRTRTSGPTVEMKAVFIAAGLDAGGHRNAGGATYEGDVDELVKRLKEELKLGLQRL